MGLSSSLWQLKEWFRSCKEQQGLFKPSFLGSEVTGRHCWVLAGRSPDVGEHKGQVNMMEIVDTD